jgi:hypothetical protein
VGGGDGETDFREKINRDIFIGRIRKCLDTPTLMNKILNKKILKKMA